VARIWKNILNVVIALLPIMATFQAQAQWLPQWTTLWQHPEPFHAVGPLRVRVAADGAIFAVLDVTHHSLSHVVLSRFNPDGSFAWTREDRGYLLGGIAFLDGGLVAIAGSTDGITAPVYVRVYDALSGDLVWQRDAGDGLTFDTAGFGIQQLAIDTSGNLMVAATQNQDYVVLRFDSNGNALPTWRHTIGPLDGVTTHCIVALPDGGAVVSGQGGFLQGGYVTVRFDAQGNALFVDQELGDLGNPLGPSRLALDQEGDIFLAASPESQHGEPLAQVWKLSSNGTHLWTRTLPYPGDFLHSTIIGGFQLAANGDPLIVVDQLSGPFRLVRLAAETGEVVWDAHASISGTPTGLSVAPNGRVLIGGYDYVSIQGNTAPRMAEIDADGEPCRVLASDDQLGAIELAASTSGWSVLGTAPSVAGADAVMSRYDADGPCTLNDRIFESGFDANALP
jgi:outer membrane protein assembly factor BamB